MKFINNNNYVVNYTKDEAIKEIKCDSRVDKIKKSCRGITLTTKSFKPKNVFKKELLKAPIGVYIIDVKSSKNELKIDIERKEGSIYDNRHHPHINFNWSDNHVCWGDVEDEVDDICINKDWYWAMKRALDLLDDYDDKNEFTFEEELMFMVGAQIQHMKNDKFEKKIKRVLKDFVKKKMLIGELSNDFKIKYGLKKVNNCC